MLDFSSPPPGLTVDDVLITDELQRRSSHQVDLRAENRALHALAARAAGPPEAMLATLVRAGLELCQAGTVGISLLERGSSGRDVFRVAALAGRLESHVRGTTPRVWSPCGACLDRNGPQLYRDPARYFTYLSAVPEPIVEGLVIPFAVAGEPLGTIWIVSHEPIRAFDAEDVRVMTSLANFTAASVGRDLTERRQAEHARNVLSAIVESSDDAIIGKTLEGVVTSWNPGAERMYGFAAEEMVGRSIGVLVPPGHQHVLRDIMDRLARGECIRDHETVRMRKDGQSIHVSLSISPIRDSQGALVGASTIARNITERKRAEARVAAQHGVTRVLVEAESTADMGAAVLEILSTALGWDVAELWLVDEAGEELRCAALFARPEAETRQFQATARHATFRSGVGLPGRVWQGMKPEWIVDVANDRCFRRRQEAVAAGLRSAVAFPITTKRDILGVIVALTGRTYEVDDAFMQLMETIGSQIGLFIERRRAEAEVRQQEEIFRLLSRCSPVGIVLTDAEGRNTYSNLRCQETLGLTAEQIRNDDTLRQLLGPDDQTSVPRDWYACVRDGREFEREIRIWRPDGSVRWIHSRAAPVRSETGRLFGYVGTVEDITEHRRADGRTVAEKRVLELIARGERLPVVLDVLLRTLEEEEPDVIASILLVNGEGTHLVFAAGPSLPTEWVRAITPLEIGPSAGACGAAAYHRRPVIVSDIATDPLCADVRHAAIDAELRACWSVPIFGSADRLLGTFAIYHRTPRTPTAEELTLVASRARLAELAIERHALQVERERLFAREQAARDKAERVNKAKDEFLAVLSHELRTPLNAIVGWGAILSRGQLDAETVATGIGAIHRNAHTLTRLIADLLDVSRIVAGKFELTRTLVDVAAVTQAAIESIHFAAEARGIAFEVEAPGAPVLIRGDAARLQQVVVNLLSNAVKFSPNGGRVGVRVEAAETDARVVVSDAGAGISPDFLPRIFERFTQDPGLTIPHGGLGLGLAIARHIVELHGGTLIAASPGLGRGATFSVTLPRLSVADPTRGSALVEAPPGLGLRGARVLVVEDEADTRELLAIVARAKGAVVEAVASARAALDAVTAFDPDLVISDIKMAGMDGYQLIRELRRQSRRVPALALTAFASPEDRQAAEAAGFEFHLPKPVDLDELLSAMSRLLGRRAA